MDIKLLKQTTLFFGKMVSVLEYKACKHNYTGWDNARKVTHQHLLDQMIANINQKDWVDVANLAMILDYRKQRGAK
jgi:hypothetical protein